MWILLLKICLLTTLFYSLYHWALRGNTFFRFNRVYLLAGMFIALALPFIPLYYAVPTVSETDLPETAFRIGNIISIEMKVNESVNFVCGLFSGCSDVFAAVQKKFFAVLFR